MKKKRKKSNTYKEQKLQRAHLKKEYLHKLCRIFHELTGKDLFSIMPPNEQDLIFERRVQAFKVVPASGSKVPTMILNTIKALVNSWFRQLKVQIRQTGQIVDGRDFYSLYVTLIAYSNDTQISDYGKAAEFKKALEPYEDIMDLYRSNNETLTDVVFDICMLNSDLEQQVYTFTYKQDDYFHDRPGCFLIMEVHGFAPEKTHIEVEGNRRPAVRAGWMNLYPKAHFEYLEIAPGEFDDEAGVIVNPLPVFIQSHALHRLRERVDIYLHGLLYDGLYHSLKDPVICRNSAGALLIEYRYRSVKTGYLRAEVYNGSLFIHTFLFLTNNGTPEGELLHRNTGLQKEDKMYLAIDKLSTFVASDIKNNKAVKEIFDKSGCSSLFDVDPLLVLKPEEIAEEKPLALRIAHYLGINMDEEFMEDIGEQEDE
jgi:hypothetical protein